MCAIRVFPHEIPQNILSYSIETNEEKLEYYTYYRREMEL